MKSYIELELWQWIALGASVACVLMFVFSPVDGGAKGNPHTELLRLDIELKQLEILKLSGQCKVTK